MLPASITGISRKQALDRAATSVAAKVVLIRKLRPQWIKTAASSDLRSDVMCPQPRLVLKPLSCGSSLWRVPLPLVEAKNPNLTRDLRFLRISGVHIPSWFFKTALWWSAGLPDLNFLSHGHELVSGSQWPQQPALPLGTLDAPVPTG